MKVMRYPAGLVALASISVAAPAQKPAQCLTAEEAGGLVTYALPSTIRGISQQCSKTLPATASLVQGGPVLAAKYQNEADLAWPQARKAFDKLAGSEVMSVMSDEGAKALLSGVMEAAMSQQIKPSDCATVDRLVNALQPLPARNLADLVIILMELGRKNSSAKPPIHICAEANG
jgi:hypothetical protein